MEEPDFSIIDKLMSKLLADYNSKIEAAILKELSKLGYNFDSHDIRNLFAQQRLTRVIKDGCNWIYLDNTILIFAWKDLSSIHHFNL